MSSSNPTTEIRHLRKTLTELTNAIILSLTQLDEVMTKSDNLTDDQKGRKIASIVNALEFANDCARHFGLGVDLRKIS